MKTKLLLLLLLLVGANSFAQFTSIPDTKFEAKLIALGIDDVADGQVLTSSINTLTKLDVNYSSITDLTGIQDFVSLTGLRCDGNNLTSLDVTKNTMLTSLNCSDNKLSNLDVSQNTALKTLEFSNNKISSIDLSKNINLSNLQCDRNDLKSIDVSKNTLLSIFTCTQNEITSLDVSKNTVLGYFQCRYNNLTTLNIKNGKNSSSSVLDFAYNKNLSYITVDDVAYANTHFMNQPEVYPFFSTFDYSEVTVVPNSLFEDKLIALGIDTDGKNGTVLKSSIETVTTLDVSNSALTDLKGLEGFTGLITLNCSNNSLSSIDLSKSTVFTTLDCSNNPTLTCIQVTDIAQATNNWTTTKDANANFSLDCRPYTLIPDSKFEEILIAAKYDDVADGKVLTANINTITFLSISNNSISDLTGIQDFVRLKTLYCNSNKLTSLDVSKLTSLTKLECYGNKITQLDISKNTALVDLNCGANNLKSLNLKNGKNTLFSTLNFNNNYLLNCIAVDDVAYANTNWTDKKNPNALYSPYDCSTVSQIPDANFEDKLIALGIDTDGKNGVILNSSIAAVTTLDVSGASIADLTGIQGFTALTTLNTSDNILKVLDLSKNSSLSTLNCSNNTTLTCIQVADVATATTSWATTKDATASFSLDCRVYTLIPDPKFEEKLIALSFDDVADGKILTSNMANVKVLNVYSSGISDLTGIQDFVGLTSLRCDANNLKSLDVSKNILLTNLECSNNKITSLDVSANTALTTLSVWKNNLTALDISKNTLLTGLNFNLNQITTLNTSTNIALRSLECIQNNLTSLDLSKNTALTYLNCGSNSLTKLNLKNGKNTLLTTLSFSYNKDLSCIIVDDVAYAKANWANQEEVYALFSPYDCSLVSTIPDPLFEDKLIALGIDTDGKNGIVLNSSIETVTTLDVSNSSLTDLTGLEGFTALATLNASNNLLNSINLSKTTAFTTLDCSNNPTLSCIQVADIAYSTENWTVKKDALANFSLDCNTYTLIPDTNFEAKLIEEELDDVADGKVLTSKINKVHSLYIYSYDNISDLTGIQDFTALTLLECNGSEITSLDLSKNTALTSLRCNRNKLTSLDLSKNKALTNIDCSVNQITSLDVSQNTALTSLYCSNNKLTGLDLTKNTALAYFDCRANQLKALDVSQNTKLYSLDCKYNKIENLDVSKNVALRSLYANSNKISNLNLKNGKNSQLTALYFSDNPTLSCIVVDDIDYANTNWADKKEAYSYFTIYDCSTTTRIPDGLFEDKLIALGIDTDGKNGHVLNSSIETLTTLDVSNSSITDVRGVEGFTALQTLNISNNLLSSIDLSKNSALKTLDCSKNASLTCIMVADIAVAKNNWTTTKDATAEFSLDCRSYTLIPDTNFEAKLIALEIDDIADGKVLTSNINTLNTLDVSNSSITDLTGIQDFVELVNLTCTYNKLTNLDVSKNTQLESLYVNNNTLTKLDLGESLINLYCNDNQITALDVSKNTMLEYLYCQENQITSLDISKNTKLFIFYCNDNKLTSLNLKNGNNTNLFIYSFRDNPTLTCINVNDVTYANNSMKSAKDATAIYTTYDCSTVTGIPDPKFEDKLIALGIDTDGKNELIFNSSIQTVTTLDVSNSSITKLTGIQGFTALTNLQCNTNRLTTLDVSKNTALTVLACGENQLEELDITSNIALTELNVSSNQLETLDLSKNIALTNLITDSNQLTALDVSKNTALTDFSCKNNEITSLNFTSNTELSVLDCSNNALTELNVDKNTKLTALISKSNQLSALNINNNTALILLDFSSNKLTSTDLTKNKALTQLFCDSNKLPSLNITENTALTELNCSSNQLTSLNLKNGNNTNFNSSVLHLENNPDLTCIKVDDKTYSDTNWSAYKDATASYANDCGLSLPSTNFTVQTKGESCLGENNGEINISATETFLYTASINGQSYPFTNNTLAVTGLAPGNYTVSISIPGETLEQNFNLVIAKGATITGKSSVSSKKVNVEITDGTAPYTVFVNGIEQFETNDSNFSLTAKGGGLLEVKTAKACEGIYSEDITGLDLVVSAYPNPTSGSFEIELPVSDKEVTIEINALDGRVISSKKYSLENGTAQLTLENQPKGVYIAKIHLGTVKNIKIIKN